MTSRSFEDFYIKDVTPCGIRHIMRFKVEDLEVAGQQPENFETIVRRYVSESQLVERSAGAKLRAMGGLMKIMFTPSLEPERYAQSHDIPKLTSASLVIDSGKWLSIHTTHQVPLAVTRQFMQRLKKAE
jgi:hypothetical protein